MSKALGIGALIVALISLIAYFPLALLAIWGALALATVASFGRGRGFALAAWAVCLAGLLFLSPLTLFMIADSAQGRGPRGSIDALITFALFAAPIVGAIIGGLGSGLSGTRAPVREAFGPPAREAPTDSDDHAPAPAVLPPARGLNAGHYLFMLVVAGIGVFLAYVVIQRYRAQEGTPSAQSTTEAAPVATTNGATPETPSPAVSVSAPEPPPPPPPREIPPGVAGYDIQGVRLGDDYAATLERLKREYARAGDHIKAGWTDTRVNPFRPPWEEERRAPADEWRRIEVARPQSPADAGVSMTLDFVPAVLNGGRAALYRVEANYMFTYGDTAAAFALRDRLKAKYGQWDWGVECPQSIHLLWGGQPRPARYGEITGVGCLDATVSVKDVRVRLYAALRPFGNIHGGRMDLELVSLDILETAQQAAKKLYEDEMERRRQQVAPDRQKF